MNVILERTASLSSGRVRRLLFHYLLFLMLTLLGVFALLEYAGLNFDPRWMVWLVPGVIPVSLAVLSTWAEGEGPARREPAAWTQYALIGLAMFAVWAGVYFLVGKLTDPSRVRYLPMYLEARIPLRPSYTLVYILLYPIFLLPYFVIRDRAAIQRLVAADLLMFATCSAAFLAVPVAFDRPALPTGTNEFGIWVLEIVRGSDPAWNCLPSEHCAAAMVAALAIWEGNRKVGAFALFAALMIGVSTLYTKQHYVVDVLAGYGVSFSIHWALRWSKSFAPSPSGATDNG